MVGREDDSIAHLCDMLEEVVGCGVAEPTLRQRAVGSLCVG